MTLGPAPSLTRARALGWLSECATTLPKHVLELCRLSFRQEFEIQDTQGDGVGFRVQEPLMSKNRRQYIIMGELLSFLGRDSSLRRNRKGPRPPGGRKDSWERSPRVMLSWPRLQASEPGVPRSFQHWTVTALTTHKVILNNITKIETCKKVIIKSYSQ